HGALVDLAPLSLSDPRASFAGAFRVA
ncbi:MAG: hypothetical protein QOF16_520, partial [Actinomycetota bacterium]|nr:hypothetical protein [Actinomycetota bacterium]